MPSQLRDAQDDYERATAVAKSTFTEEQKSRIRALATDFPKLWSDPATPRGSENAWPVFSSKTSPINKADKIYLDFPFRSGNRKPRHPAPPTGRTPAGTEARPASCLGFVVGGWRSGPNRCACPRQRGVDWRHARDAVSWGGTVAVIRSVNYASSCQLKLLSHEPFAVTY
jgi:hypothetical protein